MQSKISEPLLWAALERGLLISTLLLGNHPVFGKIAERESGKPLPAPLKEARALKEKKVVWE